MLGTIVGVLVIVLAVCVSVGLPLWTVRVHHREVPDELGHQREVVADYEATLSASRDVTQLELADVGSPPRASRR